MQSLCRRRKSPPPPLPIYELETVVVCSPLVVVRKSLIHQGLIPSPLFSILPQINHHTNTNTNTNTTTTPNNNNNNNSLTTSPPITTFSLDPPPIPTTTTTTTTPTTTTTTALLGSSAAAAAAHLPGRRRRPTPKLPLQPTQHGYHHSITTYSHNKRAVVNNDQNVVRASTTGGSTSSYPPHQSLQDPGPNPATGSTRNPKKRSRASRRAPTTVLTTDTSNFRAMVQEFTGIPAPPFSSSASPLQFPHRTRLDLFGGGSSSSSTMPSYLLRPFAHKLNPPQTLPTFLSSTSSSSSSHHVDHSSNNNNIITSTSNSNSNYQQLSELGLLHKPQNVVLNMQSSSAGTATTTNASTSTTSILHDQDHHHRQQQQQQHPITMLSFQSLLQSQAVNSSKAPSNSSSHHCHDLPLFGGLKMGSVMEELGGVSSHGYHDEHHHQMGNLRGFNGSFGGGGGGGSSSPSNATAVASTSQMVSSGGCKNVISSNSNFGGAPSDCHSKGSESTVPSRGEGIVDSWICPSD
ncbi:hypothetical protein Syun_013624 [Stephania yunnanensis]|uniref:VQ domain-containing protein n=1 Tax=Stephania yunnanensis TaxID=152371 RepID=A0AAP0JHY6_9MAGN